MRIDDVGVSIMISDVHLPKPQTRTTKQNYWTFGLDPFGSGSEKEAHVNIVNS